MAERETVLRLEELAHKQRIMLMKLGGAVSDSIHFGGDLSATDIMVALYNYKMNVDPADIKKPDRDRFILSKGHAAVSMYLAMALRGFFDFDEIVRTYGKVDSAFGMHPCKVHLPGVETSAGSLGQGLPIAVGFAAKAKHDGEKHRVYCLMGDGETCEGSIWEAAQVASSYGLGNLIGFVDRNRQLMCSYSGDAVKQEPYNDKWAAFGWNVINVEDGNDMTQLVDVLDALPGPDADKPTVVILNTIKGKGISFMEKQLGWHGNVLSAEKAEEAIKELETLWAERR